MIYLLVMAGVCGVSLWLASRTNRAARARHDSIVSWRRDLELLSEADVERADQLVRAYAAALERRPSPAQELRRASDLPASKNQLSEAMLTMARFAKTREIADPKALDTLAVRYMMLGDFVADEEAAAGSPPRSDTLQRSKVEKDRRKAEFAAFLAEPTHGPTSTPS
jgi:hypothetical protein